MTLFRSPNYPRQTMLPVKQGAMGHTFVEREVLRHKHRCRVRGVRRLEGCAILKAQRLSLRVIVKRGCGETNGAF